MIRESRDYAFLNHVMNHESCKPDVGLGYKGDLDAKTLLENPRNHFLATDFGGFLVVDMGDGTYEVHTQFLPGGRGKAAREAAREAMEHMFLETDCMKLVTFCPNENRKAINLALYAGMKKGSAHTELGVSGHIYSITVKEWLLCQQQ